MKMLLLAAIGLLTPHASAQTLHCQPATAIPPDSILITDTAGGHYKFQYVDTVSAFGNTVPDASNFALLSRSSGTTPADFGVYLNPSVVAQMKPGSRNSLSVRFSTIDQTPASMVSCRVDMIAPTAPTPAIRSVLNSASLSPTLSPGALVTILGSDLAGPTTTTTYGPTATFPTTVAGTSVFFNDTPAPLIYLSPSQINAVVPFSLSGQTSLQVKVQRFDLVSPVLTVQLQEISPGIFTSTQTGSGQGAILQQGPGGQLSYNSAENPAPRGGGVEIYATGIGPWTPASENDIDFLNGRSFTTKPVSVTIGSQSAKVIYAGTTGALSSWSVLHVTAVVPDGAGSGPQPVLLKVGSFDNAQQKVTLFVQ